MVLGFDSINIGVSFQDKFSEAVFREAWTFQFSDPALAQNREDVSGARPAQDEKSKNVGGRAAPLVIGLQGQWVSRAWFSAGANGFEGQNLRGPSFVCRFTDTCFQCLFIGLWHGIAREGPPVKAHGHSFQQQAPGESSPIRLMGIDSSPHF